MPKRFIAIWFRHLTADWYIRKHPEHKGTALVMAAPERGRMVVKSVSEAAQAKGILMGMVVADCRAIFPELVVINDTPGQASKLLHAIAEWCLRYTPFVAIDEPDGLYLDITGCTHLWGGERMYLKDILTRLRGMDYHVRAAIADTPGAAWAISRYGKETAIIAAGRQYEALLPLPPPALRIEPAALERLEKLGLYQLRNFIDMPKAALRRRFGQALLTRIDQALGLEHEVLNPICLIEPYQERLPSFEPIRTAKGIEIALQQLLETLCRRLAKEEKGLRTCIFKCYRIDGNLQQITTGTNRPTRNVRHLFKLFEVKIPSLEPDLGIELFVLEASVTEDMTAAQDALWHTSNHNDLVVAELLDRIGGKVGTQTIHRYLPDEHYWPERSVKTVASYTEKPTTAWRTDLPRPVHLLPVPELISVTVIIPDYPPTSFTYNEKVYNLEKSEGPERIEQEWWLQQGEYRDYYCVEDKTGARYWIFRLGHYTDNNPEWYLHGFFA